MAPVVVLHVLIGGLATFVVAVALLGLAIVVIRSQRSWPSWLLFVGAVATFLAISSQLTWMFAGEHGWLQRTGLQALTPIVATLITFVDLMSFCVPLALLAYCIKAVRWGLTNR